MKAWRNAGSIEAQRVAVNVVTITTMCLTARNGDERKARTRIGRDLDPEVVVLIARIVATEIAKIGGMARIGTTIVGGATMGRESMAVNEYQSIAVGAHELTDYRADEGGLELRSSCADCTGRTPSVKVTTPHTWLLLFTTSLIR